MATYLLVHGAWHGGWCWKRVAPLLRAADHEVYTPTLTGLGERAHLLSPDVDLDTHIQDVVGVLEYEDLERVVLVGHSYGGMVIAGAADRAAERLAHLVYLDAFVPRDGQAQIALMSSALGSAFRQGAESAGDGWRIPPPPLQRYGVTAAADLKWAGPRVGPHPLKTFQQPVRLTNPAATALPRTYVACTQSTGTFDAFYQQARTEPGWRYRELPTGHDAMITMPRQVADLLLELA